jgi:alkylated DNA repair protein (DNA oxidative demethylase)
MTDLLAALEPLDARHDLAPSAVLLRGHALSLEAPILAALAEVIADAPFRHMVTPGGFEMSVAMTNCGDVGWVTDRTGYRYDAIDPDSGKPWPVLPPVFRQLASGSAEAAGYSCFRPDACLINRYRPGARLSLHQDRNERDFAQPIVSVSLGLPATFLFGGPARGDHVRKLALQHGDVVVWGGPTRLHYHGVAPLKDGDHLVFGRQRVNLTFRKAV